jgi:hypothetical protein
MSGCKGIQSNKSDMPPFIFCFLFSGDFFFFTVVKYNIIWLGMVVHAYNPSTKEAEVGGL